MMSLKTKLSRQAMRKQKTLYSNICVQKTCEVNPSSPSLNHCNCVIETLLQTPFHSLSYADRLKIVERGPPKPGICSVISAKKQTTGKAILEDSMVYEMTPWMCCCKKYQKIYCWQCLLFSKEKTVWSKLGFDDFGNLNVAGKNHRWSCNHILCSKELKLFGKTRIFIKLALSDEYKNLVKKHNEIVTYNRKILSYVISAVCFLGSQGLSFYELRNCNVDNQYNINIVDSGNYYNLINIFADYNSDLRTHIRMLNKFSVFSSKVYNDIIFCISEVLTQELKKEINESLFVSLMLNEITHISLTNQLSTIFRYVNKSGLIKEHFLNFIDMKTTDRSLTSIHKCMIKIIYEFNCASKLVAYSLDGGLINNEEFVSLQTIIREQCPRALFINSYTNNLNVILSQSVFFIKEVKVFFSSLSAFADFFGDSNKRAEKLDPEIYLSISSNLWVQPSCLITLIRENKEKLEHLFLSIIFEPFNWDLNTISLAFYLFSLLKDFDFLFFLELFYVTLPPADVLFSNIEKYILIDINFCFKKIEKFIIYLHELLDDFDRVWVSACKTYLGLNVNQKIPENINESITDDTKASCIKNFNLIVDHFISDIVIRYNNMSKLQFFNLLDGKKFTQFKSKFPDAAFNSLKEAYGSYFDLNCLKSELMVLYCDKDLKKDSLLDLYNYLQKLELTAIFSETSKLSELILTMPIVFPKNEKDFSALTRIRNYINNTHIQHQSLLTSTAIMSIENEFLENIRSKKDFENNVINIFATKNQNIELIYKKL